VEWRDDVVLGEVVQFEEQVVVGPLVVDTITDLQRVDELVRRERISVDGDVTQVGAEPAPHGSSVNRNVIRRDRPD
jgi:hypothetical protein